MAKTKSKIEFKRMNINIPNRLNERIKDYADNMGINVTSAIIVLLNQALDQKDTITYMPELTKMYDDFKAMQENLNEEN